MYTYTPNSATVKRVDSSKFSRLSKQKCLETAFFADLKTCGLDNVCMHCYGGNPIECMNTNFTGSSQTHFLQVVGLEHRLTRFLIRTTFIRNTRLRLGQKEQLKKQDRLRLKNSRNEISLTSENYLLLTNILISFAGNKTSGRTSYTKSATSNIKREQGINYFIKWVVGLDQGENRNSVLNICQFSTTPPQQ